MKESEIEIVIEKEIETAIKREKEKEIATEKIEIVIEKEIVAHLQMIKTRERKILIDLQNQENLPKDQDPHLPEMTMTIITETEIEKMIEITKNQA